MCHAFEIMRQELEQNNKKMWNSIEERKRLNAAFAHDLRNPITVLKGSVKFLDQDPADKRALERLGTYTARLEQYVEAMSSVQRLEQLPVQAADVALELLRSELEETARLFCPELRGDGLRVEDRNSLDRPRDLSHGGGKPDRQRRPVCQKGNRG